MLGTLAAMAKPWPHMLMPSSVASCTQLATRQARRGARHNGGCREPEGREAKRSGPAPSGAQRSDCGASWQQPVMLNCASNSPRSDCQARAGSMPGRACPRGPRAQRADLNNRRTPQRLQRRAGCSASRVTPGLLVLRAHPSSAAPLGVRCNALGVSLRALAGIVVLLALQGG